MNSFQRKDYGTWDVWHKSYSLNELRRRRAQLAKVANSRLRALRRSKSYISGRPLIEQQQFDYIEFQLGEAGRKGFSETLKAGGMSELKIKTEIGQLEEFLAMESSTVGGSRKIENKRVQTFISKGVPEELAKSMDFYNFLRSETYYTLEQQFAPSQKIIEMVEEMYIKGLTVDDIVTEFQKFQKTGKKGYKSFISHMNNLRSKKMR